MIYRRNDGKFYRWNGTSEAADDPVLTAPDIRGVTAIAVAGTRAFWFDDESSDAGDQILLRSSQIGDGAQAKTLLRLDNLVAGPATAGEFVYWVGPTHVGRVRTDGSDVDRTFLALPTVEATELPAADGLAIDGEYLYFTQCGSGRIGKVKLIAAAKPIITWLFADKRELFSCVMDIAVDDGYVYWTGRTKGESVPTIGRVGVNGESPDDTWFHIDTGLGAARSDVQGPFAMTAVGGFVYWSWESLQRNRRHIGRISGDGSLVSEELIQGGEGPLAVFPSG